MKLLLCHNHYHQQGGEDQVFEAEAALLESRGHQVIRYEVHNNSIEGMNPTSLVAGTIWNLRSHAEVKRLVRTERPDLVHFYNTFPLLSPSVYYAARTEGAAVVQSLHNYRLFCANALFFRHGRVCEDCLGKLAPWSGLLHKCYRDDRAATAVVVAMLAGHNLLGTWTKAVDMYMAGVTEFARNKFLEGGIPEDRLYLKPNFVFPDPGEGTGSGGYALFVGRLATEKGISLLLDAWTRLPEDKQLKVIGDGPLASMVEQAAAERTSIEWLGRKSLHEMYGYLKDAAFLVFPSLWYEALPRVIVDSLAVGTPLLAVNIGAMGDLIHDGQEGLHFRPSDPKHLADRAQWLFEHPQELARLRSGARKEFMAKYTADRNYEMIMEVYEKAMRRVEV